MLEERLKTLFGVKKQITIGNYSSPATHTVRTDATMTEVSKKMEENKIRHLPVFDNDNLVGIISVNTVKLLSGLDQNAQITAQEAMTKNPYVVAFNTPLHTVLAHMMEKKISSALVKNEDGSYNIFTTFDGLQVLFDVTTN